MDCFGPVSAGVSYLFHLSCFTCFNRLFHVVFQAAVSGRIAAVIQMVYQGCFNWLFQGVSPGVSVFRFRLLFQLVYQVYHLPDTGCIACLIQGVSLIVSKGDTVC
jgi:hypothetical protein